MRGDISAGTEQLLSSISIHASTWEAAASEHCSLILSTHFNSRLYMRGSKLLGLSVPHGQISIHASTWEAAWQQGLSEDAILFQFTPLHERQPSRQQAHTAVFQFQFTPLHERQLESRNSFTISAHISIHASTWEAADEEWKEIETAYFNSRLYMRGSNYVNPAMGRDYISIHASTWEAAPAKSFQTHWCVISIHASTWEAAVWPTSWKIRDQISIHASTWEAAEKGMV